MNIQSNNGKIILKNGNIGNGAACCCNKCSGPCDGESPCPEGCACVDGQCVPGGSSCCRCGAVLFEYPYQYVELFGQTFWDTEGEANAAADTAVGFVENMADTMLANGYCSADVAIQDPRVRSYFAPWLDPPRTVWELAQPIAQIFGGCCGFTRIDVPISEMWPGTNFPIFGNRGACVDDGSNVTCAECRGCGGDPCCTFHPGQTCEEEPCAPQVCCTNADNNQGNCLEPPYVALPIGFDAQAWQYTYESNPTCESCYQHLCSAGPGVLYYTNDCSECVGPGGMPGLCSQAGNYGRCGSAVAGPCSSNPCDPNPFP